MLMSKNSAVAKPGTDGTFPRFASFAFVESSKSAETIRLSPVLRPGFAPGLRTGMTRPGLLRSAGYGFGILGLANLLAAKSGAAGALEVRSTQLLAQAKHVIY